MRFFTERCEAMRNFANKIWNASRFLMMNTVRWAFLEGGTFISLRRPRMARMASIISSMAFSSLGKFMDSLARPCAILPIKSGTPAAS